MRVRRAALELSEAGICRRLAIDDFRFVEIESKWRVLPEQAQALREHLRGRKKVRHLKSRTYYDQFLDTPVMDILRLGASLRLRYKADGTGVRLQYKGPGFHAGGVLYRSEFSSRDLEHVILEESHHDIIHFTDTSVADILASNSEGLMERMMRRHLGAGRIARITSGLILCIYHKDKFRVDLGRAYLEPSLDRLSAFLISRTGLHPLSTFWEYENEIKTAPWDAPEKLRHLKDLRRFDEDLARRFDLHSEPLDKYHRCSSSFLPIALKLAGIPRNPSLHHALLRL